MSSIKWPVRAVQAACFGALMLVAGVALSQESHLSLDDIDKLARQKLVDSMRKSDGAAASSGTPQTSAFGMAPTPASAPVVAKSERKPASKRVIPATFVGAYSDMSGTYVLYDYQGTTYTARQGSRLINGWTVASVDGFVVNLIDGSRKWTETIAAPIDAPVAVADSPGVKAITDLSSPLPPGGFASAAPTFLPLGK